MGKIIQLNRERTRKFNGKLRKRLHRLAKRCWYWSVYLQFINISHIKSLLKLLARPSSSRFAASQSTFHHCICITPVLLQRAKKPLPHIRIRVNLPSGSDYPILAHVPFHQRTRKMLWLSMRRTSEFANRNAGRASHGRDMMRVRPQVCKIAGRHDLSSLVRAWILCPQPNANAS